MSEQDVTLFRPYAFEIGEKITIESGPRRGDWEVIGLSERKVKLRCPISGHEVEWDRFCFHVEKLVKVQWPHLDNSQ
ncbi:MAG TPA: hypothetical protein PKV86_03975 [Syntrophobacteraceae bacterium]|nr:hypothetical protein [Syntrophobacteraceae bacterium]